MRSVAMGACFVLVPARHQNVGNAYLMRRIGRRSRSSLAVATKRQVVWVAGLRCGSETWVLRSWVHVSGSVWLDVQTTERLGTCTHEFPPKTHLGTVFGPLGTASACRTPDATLAVPITMNLMMMMMLTLG